MTRATAGALVIALPSALVIGNRRAFWRDAVRALDAGAALVVVFDFAGCECVDSCGFGVLVSLAKRIRQLGGTLTCAHVTGDVLNAFSITGLDRLFPLS